jgi:hypothetical protein
MSDVSWSFLIGDELLLVRETTWKVDGQIVSVPDDPLLVEDKGISFAQFVSKYEINLDLYAPVYLSYLDRPDLGYVLAYKGPPSPPKSTPKPWEIPQWYPKDFTEERYRLKD